MSSYWYVDKAVHLEFLVYKWYVNNRVNDMQNKELIQNKLLKKYYFFEKK